jgi:hypothetical protein
MPLPGSTPTVTISFAGLTIFKLKQNPPTTKECDVIVVQCPDHELVIDIQAITIDKNGSLRSSKIVPHKLDTKSNIRIEATNPDNSGVIEHVVTGVKFDRDKDMGDPYDCRWLLNIDGGEVRKPEIGVETGRLHQFPQAARTNHQRHEWNFLYRENIR